MMNTFIKMDRKPFFNKDRRKSLRSDGGCFNTCRCIVFETITSRQTYFSVKCPQKKLFEDSSVRKQSKPSKLKPSVKLYNNYSDFIRETFIDRMLESPQERGLTAKVPRDLSINYSTALRWWKYYEVVYIKFEENSGPKSSFTTEHNEYIKELLDKDPQLYSDNITNSLTERFEVFTISKSQLNNHLRNIMLIIGENRCLNLKSETQWETYRRDSSGLWNGKILIRILQKIEFSLMKPGFILI